LRTILKNRNNLLQGRESLKPLKILLLLVLTGTMLACTLSVNVPEIQTGVTETKTINENLIEGTNPLRISIQMGAGSLNIAPGATSSVEGTVDYNVMDWEPKITNSGNLIEITQSNTNTVGVPSGQIVNLWDIQLGSEPMELTISTGANEGTFDLSGLSLSRLSVSDGASKTNVTFSQPNPIVLEKLEYHTGASEVSLNGLGLAHIRNLEFYGGAGSYRIDLSGQIFEDMNVKISAGMSDFTLLIPKETHTIVTINGGLSNINASGTWTIKDSSYETGTGEPTITVNVDMAVGNLSLIQQ
jgi:hypothetical protein